ncbi:hypothetical protein HK104_007942 [Borealophlyctis nickersoniae]|nr:hypothetical protein HK104_007942 [Borealophlyctis nickersoniae]
MVCITRAAILALAVSPLAVSAKDGDNSTVAVDSSVSVNSTLTPVATTKASGSASLNFSKEASGSASLNFSKVEDLRKVKRLLEVNLSPQKFSIESKSATNTTSSKFKYEVSTSGFPRFRASMETENSTNEYEKTYMVGLARLVEVNDTINWRQSTNFVNFLGTKWSSMANKKVVVTANATVEAATSYYVDPKTGANVTIHAFVSPQQLPMPDANATFNVNSIKYSLEVSNFTMMYENSHLAIVKLIFAKQERELNASLAASSQISVGSLGAFSWNATAVVKTSGSDVPINASIVIEKSLVAPSNNSNDDDSKWKTQNVSGGDADPTGGKESVSIAIFHVNTNKSVAVGSVTSMMWDPEVAVGVAQDFVSGTGQNSAAGRTKAAIGLSMCVGLVALLMGVF